jgi:hypothetical protein
MHFAMRRSPLFPEEVRQALDEVGSEGLGILALDTECEGTAFHTPIPLILHEIKLASGRTVKLCGVCRDNYNVLVHLLEAGKIDWPLRRRFSNAIRALGLEGRKVVGHGG